MSRFTKVSSDGYWKIKDSQADYKEIWDLTNPQLIEDRLNQLNDENEQLKEQLILANGFIKMIENCYEDMTIEDILYEKYGEFQDELHLQMAIAKEEIE